MTAGGLPLAVRIEGWPEPQVVDFPVEQPGASAMIGYWGRPTDAYVLKVLKVADLRAALRGRIREPGYVRLLRRLPLADSPFAPTRMARSRIGRIHDLCRPWLRDVDRVRARALLTCTVPELGARRRDELLDAVFAERALLQLTPDISRLVDVDLPQLGPTAVPALCQRAVSGAPYRLPVGRGRHGDREIAFLVLLATARRLAQVHSLGLDLSCRFDRRDRCLVFPNVLAPAGEPGLAYVDFFGWATPLGNLAERAGFRIGYGERGPGRRLLRAMARRVAS